MNSEFCIDFTHFNKFIQREYHLSNCPFEAVTSTPQEELTYFCKFDARHGYWQVPLDAESRPLTFFITPFGRYVCNRVAFGINSIVQPPYGQGHCWPRRSFQNY